MQSVFVSGSITIKKLPSEFVERLEGLVASKLAVIIGDANGVDKAVQKLLHQRGLSSVTVFCAGSEPRNNLGSWPVKRIFSEAVPGTREYFTAKDLAMAADAEVGLMLWDAKSTGTLSNVLELMKHRKKCVVFVLGYDGFIIVKDVPSLMNLLKVMSIDAMQSAEEKIGLSGKIRALEKEQLKLIF
ncbi:hypothetical protein [Rhizobium alvei]|uniref:Uncharacterized protein n=1 Tax=Rhizobium alvei TaxID=1132659 RepID=A0ABT8YTL1_9HYPH|nr:hypothetical protein [Rhizobium alvei]MDO6967108.1 hypothetical protein [Rhizobium alvei]